MWIPTLLTLAQAAPPADQDALASWWTAAGDIWLGETAYQIGGTPLSMKDGLCEFTLTEGALIPIYSGQAPVSERMIGLAWLGEGQLGVHFTERGDVWRFANHLVTNKIADEAALRPLLSGTPYTSSIDRGVILSADPAVLSLLEGLLPMGSGAVYGADGDADETYVVTEISGGRRIRMVGVNLLEDRLRAMQRSGLDPQLMIRQDRFLFEELAVGGDQLRSWAEFRTDTPLRVAAAEGAIVGTGNFDRWMSCYRDGQDALDSGYDATVFAHGVDQDQRRHFMRLSGREAAPAGSPERPALAPVRADSTVEITPMLRGLDRMMTVSSTVTVRAEGGDIQHVTMRMPTGSALLGSWTLETLSMDGQPLQWVGLAANLGQDGSRSSGDVQQPASEGSIDRSTSATLSAGGTQIEIAGVSTVTSGGTATPGSSRESTLGGAENTALMEQVSVFQTPYRYEIMVVLPEPIPAGEERTLTLRWEGRYRYARFNTLNVSDRTLYRPIGNTTGAQPLLPSLMPAASGLWDYTIDASAEQPILTALQLVASGDTVSMSTSEDDREARVQTEGTAAQPVVAVGRWSRMTDPPAGALPGVSVNVFPRTARDADGQLSPELRRIVVFMEQHLPELPTDELELYQMMRDVPLSALQGNLSPTLPGVIQLETIISPTITAAGMVRREYPEFTRIQLAEQVAAQYWGTLIQPASMRDDWIMDGLTGAYAALYIRASAGTEAYDAHIDAIQRRLERPREYTSGRGGTTPWKKAGAQRPLGLTDPGQSDVPAFIRAGYATYILAELLRPQLGDEVFFLTLRQLAERHSGGQLSTDELQTAFELASGRDLSGFFDFWVHSGRLPDLSLTWSEADGRVSGCLTADMPFGQLDVPVSITDDSGTVSAYIRVTDGIGLFESEGRVGDIQVALDPEQTVLAASRDIQRGACADMYSDSE
jgi:hypothetical protein